ncbi:MAG TPA: hypothetical protein PK777_01930, partial [Thermoguttaceae bacterium]|nr:hypothetical protein [Thermoguttaceae bacterium]
NSSAPPPSSDAAKLWLDWLEGNGLVCRGVLHGGAEGFALTFSPKKNTGMFLRWLLAAGLAGGLAGLGWAIRKPSVRSSLARGASVWGVLAGGVWWLWLWPSVLGWILMLLSLGGFFWKRFAWVRASQKL